jgi:hypothetical protein
LLGNGEDMNFWNDNWCGTPLVDQFNIPHHIRHLLSSTISDYIINGQWNIPPQLSLAYNNINSIVLQITIPLNHSQEKLLWMHTDSGDLELKQAYNFKSQQFQVLHWATLVWNPDIPPSKSLLVRRLMHEKISTDKNLMLKGCVIPSMCNFCHIHVETSFHIFLMCFSHQALILASWLFESCSSIQFHGEYLEFV